MLPIETGRPYVSMVLVFAKISSLLLIGLGKDLYIVHINKTPVTPATRTPKVKPGDCSKSA